MTETVDAQIHFYSQYACAINIVSSAKSEEETFGQVLAFNCLTLRQMINLGSPVAQPLAKILTICSADRPIISDYQMFVFELRSIQELAIYVPFIAALGINIEELVPYMGASDLKMARASGTSDKEIVQELWPNTATIVDYRGRGKKQFLLKLWWDHKGISYKVIPKGFGILGKAVNWYASMSVILLFRYLSERHRGDDLFNNFLTRSANECGEAFLGGRLTVSSQRLLPLTIAQNANQTNI